MKVYFTGNCGSKRARLGHWYGNACRYGIDLILLSVKSRYDEGRCGPLGVRVDHSWYLDFNILSRRRGKRPCVKAISKCNCFSWVRVRDTRNSIAIHNDFRARNICLSRRITRWRESQLNVPSLWNWICDLEQESIGIGRASNDRARLSWNWSRVYRSRIVLHN